MSIVLTIAVILCAYLLGAIPFGLLVARLFGISDIRQHGSGNTGATNVWRVAGAKAALWVYLLDIGKGMLAVWGARLLHPGFLATDLMLILTAVAVVFGHVFPVYLKFRGGKGVNTALGTLIMIMPLESAIAFLVFVIVLSVTRYVSLGSMLAAITLPLILAIELTAVNRDVSMTYLTFTIVIAMLVLVTHRHNFSRLLNGTESRFSFSSKPKGEQLHG